MKARLGERLRSAFLAEHWPSNLAVMRIIIGSYAVHALLELRHPLASVSQSPAGKLFDPVGPVRLLSEPLADASVATLLTIAIVSGTLFTIGLAHRLNGPIFALLALSLMAYRNSFGFIYHTQQILALHLLVLGFAPSADRFSLDSWCGQFAKWPAALKRIFSPVGREQVASYRYGWPVQGLIFLTCLTYWLAGVAKLRHGGGLDWALDGVLMQHIGDNALRYILFRDEAKVVTFQLFQLGTAAPVVLGTSSLLLELAAPIAVLHRRLAYLIALSLFGFHVGVKAIMGIHFDYQLSGVCFAPFVRWDLVIQTTRKYADLALQRVFAKPAA